MSTHVVGFRPADAKWDAMKQAYNACKAAGLKIPDEIDSFFEYKDPNAMAGIEVNIDAAAENFQTDSREGFDVDISKLPNDIKVIRFYNSW